MDNEMLRSYGMRFEGRLLARGFWLYVWEVKDSKSQYLYVGRTGDSSSRHASSPFKRIGQHLDPSPNAKGNALRKQLKQVDIDLDECSFEMFAIGPIWPEQNDFNAHEPIRDKTAALERFVVDELRGRGYSVLGSHPRIGNPDPILMDEIRALLDTKFPPIEPKT